VASKLAGALVAGAEERRGRRFATTARAIVFRATGAKAFGVVVFAVFRYAP
jgi:hypothetical protein